MLKRIQLTTILFSVVSLTLWGNTKYTTKSAKDKNGFAYEYVENDPTQVRIYTLENGLKVYLAENHDKPKIQVYIPVKAGSTFDPKETTGLAHYLEHLMFKGNSKIGALDWDKEKILLQQISDLYEQHKATDSEARKKDIYKQIDSISQVAAQYVATNELVQLYRAIGADNTNAYTSHEETVYINEIPSNVLPQYLEIEKTRFSELTLRLFHTELETVYEEFNMSQDNEDRSIWYALLENTFPTHPYGQQTTIGKANHLKNPSMVNIHNYWNKYYVPNNMAICMMGDLNPDETIKLIDQYWGKFPTKKVDPVSHPKESPITHIIRDTVYGPGAESMYMAYRTNGLKSEDYKYITIIDFILANGDAGLLDLDLVQQQRVLSASCFPYFMHDYGFHAFQGTPREGQSLKDLENLLLQEIEKIKKGDFEDWMIEASVNNLKLHEIRLQESNRYADEFVHCFVHGIKWEDKLAFYDELEKISKDEIIDFASKFYKDNYVAVYKLTGTDSSKVKVEKPEITPVPINRDVHSEYFSQITSQPIDVIEPVFVDYNKEIATSEYSDSVDLSFIENKTNDLFSLYYIVEMGKNHNKLLPLAVNYLSYLGTDKYSAAGLSQEYFKYGLNFGVKTGEDQSYVYISGLDESFEKGVELIEHLLAHAQTDTAAYNNYVEGILKSRTDAKKNPRSLLGAMLQYGKYKENSPLRDIITEEALKDLNPDTLVSIIHDILKYKHTIFYYGVKDIKTVDKLLKNYHKPEVTQTLAKKIKYEPIETPANTIYFVDYDMVQAKILLLHRGDKYSKERLSNISLYNEYFGIGMSSIVFQELRESKALAYQAYSYYSTAKEKEDYDLIYAYMSTSVDKLGIATEAMNQLLYEMPKETNMFNASKDAVLNSIATNRITKASIFFSYLKNKKLGYDYDIREEIYNNIKQTDIDSFEVFFKDNIANKNYAYLIMGNKKDIDFAELEKLGTVKELTLEELFNY